MDTLTLSIKPPRFELGESVIIKTKEGSQETQIISRWLDVDQGKDGYWWYKIGSDQSEMYPENVLEPLEKENINFTIEGFSDTSLESYRLLFESNPLPMWIYSLETLAFLEVNNAATVKYGYSKDEFLNMTLLDIRPGEDIFSLIENIRSVSEGLDEAGVWRHITKKGKMLYVEIISHTLEWQGIQAELVMSLDVTERYQIEQELSYKNEILENIFDHVPIILSFIAPNGQFLWVNREWEQVLGWKIEEMLNLEQGVLKELYPDPEYRQEVIEFINNATGEWRDFKTRVKNGRIINTSWANVKLSDGSKIGIGQDISDRKRTEEKLSYQALHDPLTGLANRVLLMKQLKKLLERCQNEIKYVFALLFIDLDHFKRVNDSLGHLAGDRLLIVLSRRLKHCVSQDNTIVRLGGDEFVLLLEQISGVDDAKQIAEQVHASLADPILIKEREIFISTSIGIVIVTSEYSKPEEILRDADIALYQAKTLGRSRHILFNPSMHTQAVRKFSLESALRQGIKEKQLSVYYQPIVHLETSQILGFEALARWYYPEQGTISPSEFIPIAEETGLIVALDRYVLLSVCEQARHWQQQFPSLSSLTFNVNLSSKGFTEPDLVEYIKGVLQQTGIEGRSLILEITESVLIDSPDLVIDTLTQLRQLDIRIALDDFGTGYSSLSYLHRFPPDFLKIDRSFISNLQLDNSNTAIIRAIVSMARELDLVVVAEGIETEEQAVCLRSLNCSRGQGYLFSRPFDAEVITSKLQSIEQQFNYYPRW